MEDRPFGAERPLVEAVLGAARSLGDGPPVRVHSLAWTRAWSRLRVAIRENRLPDILEVGTTWLSSLLTLGVLVPSPAPRPRGPRWPAADPEERRFVVPWTWDIRFLYFWRPELEAVGLSPPDLYTMDGLKEAARRVRDAGRREAVALCGKPEPCLVHDAGAWLWAAGEDPEGAPPDGLLGPARTGLNGLAELMAWASEALLAPSALDMGTVEIFDAFAQGKFAFALAPSLGIMTRTMALPEVSVVPVPVGRSARTTFAGGSYLAVTRDAADPDQAWQALDLLAQHTRPALASHHRVNRRMVRRACAEVGDSRSVGRYFADRLRPTPRSPAWAAAEHRLSQALADWLQRARAGADLDLEAEASALGADVARVVAL